MAVHDEEDGCRDGGYLTMIATFPDQEPVILVISQVKEKDAKAKRESLKATKRFARGEGQTLRLMSF